MKKMLLSLAVSAALAGCGGGETLEDVKNDTTPVSPTISVKFDPSGGVILSSKRYPFVRHSRRYLKST